MPDAATIAAELVAKLSKVKSKVKRLESALAAAKAEGDELAITMRMLLKLGYFDEDDVLATDTPRHVGMNEQQALVYDCTGTGEAAAVAPKDVAAFLQSKGHNDISGDYVRTTLWRLAQRGTLKSENGLYWRPGAPTAENVAAPGAEASRAGNGSAGLADGSQGRASHLDPEGSIPSSSTPSRPPSVYYGGGEPEDDDVPF